MAEHTPGQHPEDTFTHRFIPALGRTVHRMGLAPNYGLDGDDLRRALDMGPEYVFWTPRMKKATKPLKEALAADRSRYIVATGPTLGFFPGALRKAADKALEQLGTDYLDYFQIFWLGKTSAWTDGVVEEMVRLRESGLVRALGISIHDRPRAGKLAVDSPLDMLMIRYNAAHPGAERDIFPHLHHRKPAIVAYTATCWKKLMATPKGWDGPPATAGDCYRFALSDPHVDLVLTGPSSFEEFQQNLDALGKGPMQGEEMARMRALGEAVKKDESPVRSALW